MTGEIRARRRRQQNDSQSGRDAALLATVKGKDPHERLC